MFKNTATLNTEVLAWLERTANGTEHHGIWKIPAVEFETERNHLPPYSGVPTPHVEYMMT